MAAAHHLIVGGQRSGKSRHAERLAQAWQRADAGHGVTVVATALAFDAEMQARIARHRADRPAGFATVEAPLALTAALRDAAAPGRLLLVDCLTLWLTNWLMPMDVLFVSNEVGWGVSPMTREARFYVDELGRLNQAVAQRCQELTLMVAGQAWTRAVVKEDE
jgi:adenosylcobinamide kinase/adenosylcobinamide-phosphate guanylyltransferase